MVGDLPFGSYQALGPAGGRVGRAVHEGGRLRRGQARDGRHLPAASSTSARASRARARSSRPGIPVMGHVGLTPQSASALGGYKAQGRDARQARPGGRRRARAPGRRLLRDRVRGVPAAVTETIMERMRIPVIGIGAGPATDGQVLVFHDLLGIYDGRAPRFAKRFAEVKRAMVEGVQDYADGGPRAPLPGRRAHLRDRPRRAGALPRDRRPGQALGHRRRHELTAKVCGIGWQLGVCAMAVHSAQLRVSTEGNGDIIDITRGVQEVVETAGIARRHRERVRRPLDRGDQPDRVRARRRPRPAGADGAAGPARRDYQHNAIGRRHQRPRAPAGRDHRPLRDRARSRTATCRPAPGSSSCSSTSTTPRASGP